MKNLLTLLALCLCIVLPLQAQSADALLLEGKQALVLAANTNDVDEILKARALFEKSLAQQPTVWGHYYVALADYRAVNAVAEQDKDRALEHLDNAIDHLKESLEMEETAEAYALLSGVYGRKISQKPLMGMLLGPKASSTLKKAKGLEADNPRVVFTEAMSDYNTPKMWGGSKERAMTGFRRAIELFEQQDTIDPLQPTWGHEEVYAWLGIAFMDQGNDAAAKQAFQKALEVNPDFGWVRYVLLPGVAQASQ